MEPFRVTCQSPLHRSPLPCCRCSAAALFLPPLSVGVNSCTSSGSLTGDLIATHSKKCHRSRQCLLTCSSVVSLRMPSRRLVVGSLDAELTLQTETQPVQLQQTEEMTFFPSQRKGCIFT